MYNRVSRDNIPVTCEVRCIKTFFFTDFSTSSNGSGARVVSFLPIGRRQHRQHARGEGPIVLGRSPHHHAAYTVRRSQ